MQPEPGSEPNAELREKVDQLESDLDSIKTQCRGQLNELAIQVAVLIPTCITTFFQI